MVAIPPVPPNRSTNLPPRTALALAAEGQLEVSQDALTGLLAGLALDVHNRSGVVGKRVDDLLEMVFAGGAGGQVDPAAVLDLVERLSRLHLGQQAELRRTVELLSRITRPSRPRVTVQAAGQQVNISAAQQVAAPIDWGVEEADR